MTTFLIALTTLIALLVLAAVLSPRRLLRTEIVINAPAAQIWPLIADPARHLDWNPNLRKMTGSLQQGATLSMTLAAPGKRPITFHPRVLERVDGSHLTWRGRLWVPGIFDGTHTLRLEKLGPDQTRFVNEEGFTGLLLWIMNPDQFRPDFEAADAGLKRLAEGQTR